MFVYNRDDHFRFSLIFIKKITKPVLKNQNQTKTDSNRLVSVRFSSVILEQKPVQTGLAWVFSVWLGFFRFGSGFFSIFFCSGSVRVFWFRSYKTEPVGFFKNSNLFFSQFDFFCYFFFQFSWFFDFFAHP